MKLYWVIIINVNCILIIEVPRLEKAAMPITKIFSSTASTLQCGENLCISSNPSLNFTVMMNCILLRSVSTNDYEFNVYKDNLFYSNEPMINLTEEIIFDSLGMYKTVLNDSCGMDTATSVLSLCGKPYCSYVCIIDMVLKSFCKTFFATKLKHMNFLYHENIFIRTLYYCNTLCFNSN